MNLQLTLAARYLAGRKLRTFLTTLAVVFGVLVIFGMNVILPTMATALMTNAVAAHGMVDLTITHETGEAFPQEMLAKVQAVDGVRAAAVSLNRTVNLPVDFYDKDSSKPDRVSAFALIGIDPYLAKTLRVYPITVGRYLEAGDGASALITQSLADDLSVKLGGRFSIPTVNGLAELTVVGIMLPRMDTGNEQVLVNLPEAQKLTGELGKVNTLDVNLNTTDEAQRAKIVENIKSALGEGYKTGSLLGGEEMASTLQMGQVFISMFGVLALFMGAFIIFNTFRTVISERRRDIGMLRALGATRGAITGMILVESLLQGAIGTGLGLLLGYLLAVAVIGLAGPIIFQFLNLKMGAPVISPVTLIVSILLGVGVTVAAGLFPAINASHLTPLEALRPSGAEMEFKRQTGRGFVTGLALIILAILALFSGSIMLILPGGILFLVGLVLVAPALVSPIAGVVGKLLALVYAQDTGELARGNIVRQPSRAAITASATMLGLAIIVAAGGLVTSMTGTLDDMMQKSLGSDYLFMPPSVALWGSNVGAGADLANRLRGLDSVGDVSSTRFVASVVSPVTAGQTEQVVSLLGIDPVVFPKVAGLHFQQGIEFLAYQQLASERAMIVNGVFLAATGAKVGDTVELVTPKGKISYRIVAMAVDMLNAKVTTAYISQANMQADFDRSEDMFIQFNLKPGADAATAETQIKAIAADYPQFRVIAGKVYYAEIKALMNAAFAGMYFILSLLALPSLVAMLNTLAIGVIERTREIGMLRAVGATRKQVRTMVIAEALLLASIGAAFGILSGLYLGYVLVTALALFFKAQGLFYSFSSALLTLLLIGGQVLQDGFDFELELCNSIIDCIYRCRSCKVPFRANTV